MFSSVLISEENYTDMFVKKSRMYFECSVYFILLIDKSEWLLKHTTFACIKQYLPIPIQFMINESYVSDNKKKLEHFLCSDYRYFCLEGWALSFWFLLLVRYRKHTLYMPDLNTTFILFSFKYCCDSFLY